MREALRRAAEQLAAVSDVPRLEAEWLAADCIGVTRSDLLLALNDIPEPAGFAARVERRLNGEPLAYILGTAEFRGLELAVGPGALIPRADSETLIEAAIVHFGEDGPRAILDLGTGPGTLLLAALHHWPEAIGLGIDRSEAALSYAHRNAKALGLDSRAELRLGNWFDGVDGPFDLILANPPYVGTNDEVGPGVAEHEPHEALFAGTDGLDDIRIIAAGLGDRLAPGGIAVIEIGSAQREAASAVFEGHGFTVTCRRDLASHDRALLVKS